MCNPDVLHFALRAHPDLCHQTSLTGPLPPGMMIENAPTHALGSLPQLRSSLNQQQQQQYIAAEEQWIVDPATRSMYYPTMAVTTTASSSAPYPVTTTDMMTMDQQLQQHQLHQQQLQQQQESLRMLAAPGYPPPPQPPTSATFLNPLLVHGGQAIEHQFPPPCHFVDHLQPRQQQQQHQQVQMRRISEMNVSDDVDGAGGDDDGTVVNPELPQYSSTAWYDLVSPKGELVLVPVPYNNTAGEHYSAREHLAGHRPYYPPTSSTEI